MDATPEQTAEGSVIVHVLAAVLDRLVVANAPVARADPGQVTKFHAMKAPGIGILQYLERIHKYASCSNECFILALIYIDRLIQRNNFLLTELNVHRVTVTAVLLAAKFFDDAYYNNAYYAKVGGVLVSEMNGLEVDFLFRINFSLHVPPEVFEKYRAELISQAPVTVEQPPIPALLHHATNPVNPQQPLCNPPPIVATTQKPATQITPSPPAGAAQVVQDTHPMVYPPSQPTDMVDPFHYQDACLFFPVQRANSLPEALPANTRCYAPTTQSSMTTTPPATTLCSHQSSYSAPAMIVDTHHHHGHHALVNPVVDPYNVVMEMEHTIYPLQGTLLHHHHHGKYPQQGKDPRLQQMLAGAGP